MSRRVKLPGASELFRPTGTATPAPTKAKAERAADAVRHVADGRHVDVLRHVDPAPVAEPAPASDQATAAPPASSVTGRVKHEEKITVYVSREELLALEQARLRLRGEIGLAVDRGRLVRAAIAYALADLESAGEDGELVRRLTAP